MHKADSRFKDLCGDSLLERALNNPLRRHYGFNILFAGYDKAPGLSWEKWQEHPQSDEDVKAYYDGMGAGKVTCWGFVCGFKGLQPIDFDWSWVYRLWREKFGDRAETLTVRTPNGGFRPYYICEKPETNDKFKESLHVEFKGQGRFVVHEGKAKREDGNIGEYEIVVDHPIYTDNKIVADTLSWLEEIASRYNFLRWKCLQPYFKKKLLNPPHEVRLFVCDIMVCEGFSDEEIINLFCDFENFDPAKTEYQVSYTRNRVKAGLKPPTCETLRGTLGWDGEGCRGCPRKGKAAREEGIKLGDYRLELRGSNAIIYDKNGEPVYSARANSLSGYLVKKDLAKKLGVDEATVDRAVAQLTLKFEDLDMAPQPTQIRPSPELVKKVLDLLKDPKILCFIELAFREQGLIGETKNAFSTFFDMLSTLTDNPINRRWSGRSGIGKSAIVVKVAQVFPPEMMIIRSGLTKKAVWHMPGSGEIDERTRVLDLKGKVLVLLEESESREFLNEAKPLLSHDMHELKYEFTVKEAEGLTTYVQVLRGWPAYVGITTAPELREEQQTRALIGTPDRGEMKYKSVIVVDATQAAEPWKARPATWTPVVQEAIRQLKPLKIWIPWLPYVAEAFPAKEAKSMREWFFFRSFIESITLLLQYQLPHVAFNNEEYVVAPPFILELAILIGEAAFKETITGLETDLQDFYQHLIQQGDRQWTRRELLDEYWRCTGERIGRTTLTERYLNKLVDLGLMDVDESKKPYKYSVTAESLPLLTEFKNVLEKVKSEETKRVLASKTLSPINHALPPPFHPDGASIPWREFWGYLYSLQPDDDVLKLFKRSKEEEYPTKGLFSKSVDDGKDSDEKKPKTDNLASATTAQPKPEDTLESEVLPKCLRVPPGLEDHMQVVELGEKWFIQCVLCASEGKQFYTANVEDMTSHIQGVHNKLRSLTSSIKPEAELTGTASPHLASTVIVRKDSGHDSAANA